MSVRIGLTGPIGCGKSTIAGWLADEGAVVIDADDMVREVTGPGSPALAAILERFGPAYRLADGTLHRAALGRLVFADPAALRDLEAIVHPAVRPAIEAAVAAGEASGAPAIVIEAIKLVEGGLAALCDEVWLVTCDPDAQRSRLEGRGVGRDDAERRIRAQGDLVDRLRPAVTRLINTSGPTETTRRMVEDAFAEALAAVRPR